jgi:putative hydrolase of the HAD superfamily
MNCKKAKNKKKYHIKAIFFDLGGVIVWGPKNSMIEALAELVPVRKDRLKKFFAKYDARLHKGLMDTVALARAAGECFKITMPSAPAIKLIFSRAYAKHKKIRRSVIRMAEKLERSYAVGIISDTISDHVRINRRRGIFRSFKPVILSCEVGMCKPYAAIFRYALKKAGVKPGQSVFIDDLRENIAGARKVGMHGILFRNIAQLKRDLKKLGVAW